MNKFLPKMIASKTKNNNFPTKLLLVLLFSSISWMANAQCIIGPYQYFESFRPGTIATIKTTMQAEGWSFAGSASPANTGGFGRTGMNFLSLGNTNTNSVITPFINNPSNFTFYYRSTVATAGKDVAFTVDWSADGITWSTAVPLTTNTASPAGAYQSYSITTFGGVAKAQIRIKVISNTGGALVLDDLSCTSTITANNTIVVPEWGAASSTINCTTPFNVPSSSSCSSFSFYDQGGNYDNYNKQQTEILYFAPTTAGEKVQFQFNNFNVDLLSTTKITVYNGNGTTAGTEFAGFNSVSTVTAGTTVTASATIANGNDTSGYITVKFVTSSTAAAVGNTGYDITVRSVTTPTITNLLTNTSGCNGSPLIITGTNLLNATVTIGGTPVASYGANTCTSLTVTPANGSSGTVVVTNAVGFANSVGTYTSNSLPVVSAASSVCIGSTITLSPTTGGTWTSSDTTKATVTNIGVVTGVAAGSATFTYTNTTTTCSATTSAVTINALPVVTAGSSVCVGSTITLSPTSGGTWASSDTTKATITSPGGVVTGVAAGSTTFTYTNTATTCSATTSAVTINALPSVTAGSSVCIGSQIILSPTTGGTWTSSDITKATVTNAGVVTGVAAGTATFTFTDAATTCSATTTSVTINALPVVSTGAASVCVGSTITLSPTTGGTWSSSDTTKATVTNTGVVTGVAGGSATFTFTDATTNCSATTTAVTINAQPVVTAGASVCVGSTITLSPTIGGTWTSSSNSIATVTNSGVVTGVAAGSATFIFTDTTSTTCSATTSAVSINALPVVSAGASVCVGSTITLSPTIGGTWTSSNSSIATVTNSGVVTGVATGSATFTFLNTTTNCSNTTTSVTIAATTAPIASAATAITGSSFTANWSAASGATGYYLDVSTSNTFATFLTGFNGLSVGNVTTYGISGLTSGVTYYYRVKATGSCGISAYSGTITVVTTSTTYCTPTAPSSTSYYINSFDTTGGLTNITNDNTGFSTGGYANYAATLSCSQYAGSAINFSIANKDTSGTYYYYVWIDWNNDGDFLDAGETIVATTNYSAGPYTGAFTIPGGQASGSYRMRVSNDFIYTNTSCTNGGYGEYEDYTVIVVPIPPCTVSLPSALTVSNIAATAATLSWSDASAAPTSVYDYYYNTTGTAPTGATTPNGTVNGVTSVNLSGLTLGQTYYCWVRTDCSGTTSAWAGSVNFTTISLDIINLNTNGSITTCNARFYDSGGSGSSYSNNENYTYTFTPTAGSNLKAVFNSFKTESGWDGLVIYNGNSTAAPIISSGLPVGSSTTNCPAGSFYGTTSPGTIYSTAADGSLTFQFRSDISITKAGWDASLTCVTLPTITSFTPTSSCAGTYPLVTITGTNFTGATSVKFNGVTAAFTIVNSTTITATLPATATSGTITVSNAQATGTSTTAFSIYPVPPTPNAGAPGSICVGDSFALAGTATGPSTTTVLSQDFNAGPFPSGWTRTSNDFQTSYEFVSSGNTWPANGYTGYCSYFWTYVLSSGYSSDMITSAMDLSTYTASTLTFWIYNSSGTDNLNVYANNNGGAYTQVGTTYNTYGSWTQITISLNSFVGAGFNAVKLKFTGSSDYGLSNIGIDDILVTGTTTVTNSWSSNPAGFTSSSLTPIVNPIITTTYTLSSTYGNGCASTSNVVITVNQKPTITSTLAVTALCASTSSQSATLNYTATTNSPTSYSIVWNAAAHTAGFADQATTTIAFVAGAGTITGITIPANMAPNQYTGSLTITNAGGCTSSYTITINIGKLWNGTTSNDWGYANNWTPSGVPTATDCVVIPSGTPNSPEISANAFAGNLTINSSASLVVDSGIAIEVQDFVKTNGTFTLNSSASLVQINNVANTGSGNMIYKRSVASLKGYDYVYWSSPVASQPITGMYSTPTMGPQYYWDTLANNNNGASGNIGQGNWSPAYGAMQVGKGYIIRGSSSYSWTGSLTANFTGIPNNGDLIMSVARGGYTGAPYSGANGVTISNQEDNYNLIGNPYPSAIKAIDFLNWPSNTTKIQGVVYLWTHNSTPTSNANTFYSTGGNYNYFTNDYLAYNNVGASSGPGFNGYIAAGQGFFVTMMDGAADATQSVVFNNSMRNKTYANTNFFKGNSQATQPTINVNRIWLDLVDNNSFSTRTLVGYIDDATVHKDRQFDAYTPVGNDNIIYSLVEGDSNIIQGRPLPFDTNDQVPLGYHSKASGNFTIAIAAVDGLFEQGQPIYLEDKLLNIIYDLRQAPYVFATASGTFNDRFVLRYTNSNLSSEQFATNSAAAFITNQKLQIKATNNITSVQIYDVAGKLIETYSPVIKALELNEGFPFANGVYFAKIKLEDGSLVTQKLMN